MTAAEFEGQRYLSLDDLHDALRRVDTLHDLHTVASNAAKSSDPAICRHDLIECRETPACGWRTDIALNFRPRWIGGLTPVGVEDGA